jgi:hypothetical protein
MLTLSPTDPCAIQLEIINGRRLYAAFLKVSPEVCFRASKPDDAIRQLRSYVGDTLLLSLSPICASNRRWA